MANGTEIHRTPGRVVAILLDAAAATTDGVWIEAPSQCQEGDIEVTITGTATIQLRSASPANNTKPENTEHGNQIGSDITASGSFTLASPARWTKMRVTSFGSGTVTAVFVGRTVGS